MAKQSRSIARLQLAALGVALAASLPTESLAENWVVVMEQDGVGTFCVDRDSIRWGGSVASYNTQYCTSSHPGLAGNVSESSVDCAQNLSGDFVYLADERVFANSPSGVAALAVCRGL